MVLQFFSKNHASISNYQLKEILQLNLTEFDKALLHEDEYMWLTPVYALNEIQGLIIVSNKRGSGELGYKDIVSMQVIASQLGLFIRNKTLIEDLTHFNDIITQLQDHINDSKDEMAARIMGILHNDVLTILESRVATRVEDLLEEKYKLAKFVRTELQKLRLDSTSDYDYSLKNIIIHNCIDPLKKSCPHIQFDFKLNSICLDENDDPVEPTNLDSKIKKRFYRIAQSAIQNSIKHGNPTNIGITLDFHETHINFVIEDNGWGFEIEGGLLKFCSRKPNSFGLIIILAECILLKAHLEIDTANGKGTKIGISMPFKPLFD